MFAAFPAAWAVRGVPSGAFGQAGMVHREQVHAEGREGVDRAGHRSPVGVSQHGSTVPTRQPSSRCQPVTT